MQPYSQQPPPRPPYGQVPYGYTPVPPTPPKRKGPWIVAAVAIAVVLGVLVFVVVNNKHEWLHSGDRPSTAGAGDCIKVNSASTTAADVEKVDCASPDAVYKVGTKEDGDHAMCPSDSYDLYTQSDRVSSGFTLCLMLNAGEGDCFSHLSATGTTAKVACSAADAEARTDKVVNGQAAASACPADTALVLVYPEPGETICLNHVTPA